MMVGRSLSLMCDHSNATVQTVSDFIGTDRRLSPRSGRSGHKVPAARNRSKVDIRYVTVDREIACVNSYYFHQTEAEICL